MRGCLKFIILTQLLSLTIWGNTPSFFAQKGIEAYKKGNYTLAEEYFQRSLKEAKIKSEPEIIGRALLNLISLEMERENFLNVKFLIEEFPEVENKVYSFYKQWKKSQYYHLSSRHDSSLAILKSLKLKCPTKALCQLIEADLLKVRVYSASDLPSISEIDLAAEKIKPEGLRIEVKNGAGGVLSLRKNNLPEASKRLESLAEYYRKNQMYFRMARAYFYQAVIQIKKRDEAKARSRIKQAVGVFESLGLKNHVLKTVLLNLYLFKSKEESDAFEEHLKKSNLDISILDLDVYFSQLQRMAGLQVPENLYSISRR